MFKRSIFLTSILCLLMQSTVFSMARIPTPTTAGLATRATEFIPSISQQAPTITSTEFRSTLNPETIQNIAKTPMYVSGGFRPSQKFFDQMMINKAAQELTEEELEILRLLNSTQRSLSRAASSRGAFRRTSPKLFRATPQLYMTTQEARQILGVPANATKTEISAAFRKKIQEAHPDHAMTRGMTRENANELTRQIIQARKLLNEVPSDTTSQSYQNPTSQSAAQQYTHSSQAQSNTYRTNNSAKNDSDETSSNVYDDYKVYPDNPWAEIEQVIKRYEEMERKKAKMEKKTAEEMEREKAAASKTSWWSKFF